jgi:hypothetical protein
MAEATRSINTQRAAEAAAREDRRRTVAAGLLAGLSLRDIARGLNVSLGTVQADAKAVRQEWAAERVQQYEALVTEEGARLDALMVRHWQAAVSGDVAAAAIVLKIIDRRCKLLGLDAAQRVELQASVSAQVDVRASVAWVQLRGRLVQALSAFPEAKVAVLAALTDGAGTSGEEVSDGSD